MKHYGLEYEFFVTQKNKIVPAYLATLNLDGASVAGELRTKPHTSITDAIFELMKLIHIEKKQLALKGFKMSNKTEVMLTDNQIKELRKARRGYKKDFTEELSIYGDKTSKVLPLKEYKASLQINISDNDYFYAYETASKHAVKKDLPFSKLFDYVSIIRKLDEAFSDIILKTKRMPGVYSIKRGEKGERIEYRSLPNNINLLKLEELL